MGYVVGGNSERKRGREGEKEEALLPTERE